MTTSHQPGSPVDIDELEREGHEWDHGQLLRAARSLVAELRTLRARVEELECAEAELNLENGRLQDRLNTILTITKRGKRITDLEAQLAAAREEQRLEVQLVALLTERNAEHSLQLRKHGVEPWMGVVRCRDGIERVFECDESEGLPALLRAILEVEAKGG